MQAACGAKTFHTGVSSLLWLIVVMFIPGVLCRGNLYMSMDGVDVYIHITLIDSPEKRLIGLSIGAVNAPGTSFLWGWYI